MENKIFWVLFDVSLYQVVQSKPRSSLTLYEQYKMITDFKATFQNMHIRAKGVVEGVWYGLAYLITEDDLIRIIAKWPPTWLEPGASFLKTPTKPRTAT